MTVIDAFPLGYGPEILLLRLATLNGTVDQHIICEADLTHSGRPRQPLWPTLKDRPEYAPYLHKILWSWHNTPSHIDRPHAREEWIRDTTHTQALATAHPDDWILTADADEIPNPEAIALTVRRGWTAARIYGRYHEWRLDLRATGGPYLWEYRQPILARTSLAAQHPGHVLRATQLAGHPELHQVGYPARRRRPDLAGWHLTLQGTPDDIVAKLRSFAHTELAHTTTRDVTTWTRERRDILNRAPLEHVPHHQLPAPVTHPATSHHFAHMLENTCAPA